MEPQEEGILGLELLERQSASDAVQCDHSRFTTNFDLRTRPTLPVCQLAPRGMLGRITGAKQTAYCSACQAVGDKCGLSSDCSTGICAAGFCLASSVLPGDECTLDEQCLSETCRKGVCTVTDAIRCDASSGPKGGCPCDPSHGCGGGKCIGSKKHLFGTTKGVCSGPAAPALCEQLGPKEHCCSNIECEWSAGVCKPVAAEPWPRRSHCDGAKRAPATSPLLANE